MALDDETTAIRRTTELPAVSPAQVDDRALGQILIRTTRLTEAQLEQALEWQRDEGGRLGEILLRRNLLDENEVLKALAWQLDLPLALELKPEECDPELALKVPINFAKQHRLVPIRRVGRAVEVAVADPLDVHALDDVRRSLGAEIAAVMAPQNRILEAINKIYARQEGGVELENQGGDDEMGGEAEELVDILDLTDEAPIIRWVNS